MCAYDFRVAGVGSGGPFIAVMLNPELVNTNDILRLIVENSKSVQNFVFYFGLFLVVLFFIVNSFLAFLFYYIEKISREKNRLISNSLLKNYLNNNYNFFLRRNSNELIKNIFGRNYTSNSWRITAYSSKFLEKFL